MKHYTEFCAPALFLPNLRLRNLKFLLKGESTLTQVTFAPGCRNLAELNMPFYNKIAGIGFFPFLSRLVLSAS